MGHMMQALLQLMLQWSYLMDHKILSIILCFHP
uniref:Uncharacterized protein n=1 Tax=Setaria italica TaxID=4555 RepID=K3ZFS5_SETIT